MSYRPEVPRAHQGVYARLRGLWRGASKDDCMFGVVAIHRGASLRPVPQDEAFLLPSVSVAQQLAAEDRRNLDVIVDLGARAKARPFPRVEYPLPRGHAGMQEPEQVALLVGAQPLALRVAREQRDMIDVECLAFHLPVHRVTRFDLHAEILGHVFGAGAIGTEHG